MKDLVSFRSFVDELYDEVRRHEHLNAAGAELLYRRVEDQYRPVLEEGEVDLREGLERFLQTRGAEANQQHVLVPLDGLRDYLRGDTTREDPRLDLIVRE